MYICIYQLTYSIKCFSCIPECNAAYLKENLFIDLISKKKKRVLIMCFIPRFKGRSQSVPTNCTRLRLEFYLSKQKKKLIQKQYFLLNGIMEEISHLREL